MFVDRLPSTVSDYEFKVEATGCGKTVASTQTTPAPTSTLGAPQNLKVDF